MILRQIDSGPMIAFDAVEHNVLSEKLNHVGIIAFSHEFLISYSSNTILHLKIEGNVQPLN